jgi:putative endonuclease
VKSKSYYVYVLRCEDGSFYTGYTTCLGKRLESHRSGRGARYTQQHGVVRLVHSEAFATRAEAMRRERQVKRLSHSEKEKLQPRQGNN